MAIEKVIKIKVDSKDAVKGIKEVDKSIEEVNESTDDLTGSIGGMGGAAISSFKSMSKGVSVAVKKFNNFKRCCYSYRDWCFTYIDCIFKSCFYKYRRGAE